MLEVYEQRLEAAAVMFDSLESDRINMETWREIYEEYGVKEEVIRAANTYEELHKCGTPACFAGWVAVSPEFIAAGGTSILYDGSPLFNGCNGTEAIQEYFGVDYILAAAMCFTADGDETEVIYNVEDVEDITPAHIAKTIRWVIKDTDAIEKLLRG